MNHCPQINKNTKLYQKFLERKSKKDAASTSQASTPAQTSTNRSQSNWKSHKQQASIEQLLENTRVNDENVNTLNIPLSKLQMQNNESIDDLLKKQLEKQRNRKNTIVQNEVDFTSNMEFRLECTYLRAENERLKQKLAQQKDKTINLQQSLNELIIKTSKLESDLLQTNKRMNEALSQIDIWKNKYKQLQLGNHEQFKQSQDIKQIEQLRQQNYLAKDYIYKLTLKLYQSEQDLKVKRDQIERMKSLGDKIQQSPRKMSRNPQHIIDQEKMDLSNQANISLGASTSSPLSKQHRISCILSELESLNAAKVFNGKNRRRKIELQRQLQQLNHS